MKRVMQSAFVLALAVPALAIGQGPEVMRIVSGMRAALGGEDALAGVKTVAIEGSLTRPRPDGTSSASDIELLVELPDRYVRKEVFAQMGPTQITRRTGFNGADLIEEVDTPPSAGGGMIMRFGSGAAMPGGQATPEQIEKQRQATLLANRREFARLSLGMFGAAPSAYPLEITYGGQAESADGKADILELKHQDGFAGRLFVDASTHLPLMLTWMDKEPLRLQVGGPGNIQVLGGGGHRPSPEEIDKIRQEMEQRMKEAEANRRTVEYRVFYGEYRSVNGVRLPSKIQRMVDGTPAEELAFENIKVNSRIDAGKFRAGK